MLQEVASMPRMVKVRDVQWYGRYKREGNYEYYMWYVPRYEIYTDIVARRHIRTGRWFGVYRSKSEALYAYKWKLELERMGY